MVIAGHASSSRRRQDRRPSAREGGRELVAKQATAGVRDGKREMESKREGDRVTLDATMTQGKGHSRVGSSATRDRQREREDLAARVRCLDGHHRSNTPHTREGTPDTYSAHVSGNHRRRGLRPLEGMVPWTDSLGLRVRLRAAGGGSSREVSRGRKRRRVTETDARLQGTSRESDRTCISWTTRDQRAAYCSLLSLFHSHPLFRKQCPDCYLLEIPGSETSITAQEGGRHSQGGTLMLRTPLLEEGRPSA